jgi:eukaryotic translation initiation factor 2-alpha kinase 1
MTLREEAPSEQPECDEHRASDAELPAECDTLALCDTASNTAGHYPGAAALRALYQAVAGGGRKPASEDCRALAQLFSSLSNAQPGGVVSPLPAVARQLAGVLSGTAAPLPEGVTRLLSPLASWFSDLQPLGRGGFGSVYTATSVLDGRRVALKRVSFRCAVPPWAPPSALAASDAPVLREIRALAALSHPNVVRYYTAWTEPRWASLKQQAKASTGGVGGMGMPSPHARLQLLDTAHDDDDEQQGDISEVEDASVGGSDLDESKTASSTATWSFPAPLRPGHVPLLMDAAAASDDADDGAGALIVQARPATTARAISNTAYLWPWYLFLSMELVPGPTMGQWLATRQPVGHVLAVCAQLARGLAHMHARGVLHRDIKPSNVAIQPAPSGRPPRAVLLDFGLAALMNAWSPHSSDDATAVWVLGEEENEEDASAWFSTSSSSDGQHTRGVGTATYAAPEQLLATHAHGDGSGYGPPADVFSLGLVLVESLCGPFETAMERAATLLAARAGNLPVDRLEALAPGSSALVAAMLSHQPSARPTAAQVARSKALVVHRERHHQAEHGAASDDVTALQAALEAKQREMNALQQQLQRAMAVQA